MAIFCGFQNILEIKACYEQTQSAVVGERGDAGGFLACTAAASAREATCWRARIMNTTQPKG